MNAGEERKEECALFNSEKGYKTFFVVLAEYCKCEREFQNCEFTTLNIGKLFVEISTQGTRGNTLDPYHVSVRPDSIFYLKVISDEHVGDAPGIRSRLSERTKESEMDREDPIVR
jgi:hypothetical protein